MASSPNYASQPLAPDVVQISAANTNRDGTGTVVLVTSGSESGVVLEQVRVTAVGVTMTGMVRFFLSTDGGISKRLLVETPVRPVNPGADTQAFTEIVDALTGLTLCGEDTHLYAATHNAETFNVFSHKAGL